MIKFFGKKNYEYGPDGHKKSYYYLLAFWVAIAVGLLLFLPYLFMDKGYFLYYGDFNVQQIPFYKLAHNAVRHGNFGWSWTTDLGANFISSYSFYLVGSPFFWLTLPFPNWMVPYLMGPLLVLKFGVAGVTSFAFIKRFVKQQKYAFLGSLLYAFSGFMIYNIFFNHFNDVVALFPLLLIALEELVQKKRRGVFALAVAMMAILNYFMFVGNVVFVTIYFFVRFTRSKDDFKLTLSKFFNVAFEAVLGLLLAAFILLPSIADIGGNPRVSDGTLKGFSALMYDELQRYFLIIQSFFFPPDIPARPNFFPDSNSKWSSVAAWLPMFGMAGVLAFWDKHKKSFLSVLLKVLFVFALFPILNNAFHMFNYSYYARWFYMLTLIMALVTVKALEDRTVDFIKGIKRYAFIVACFLPLGLIPARSTDEIKNTWWIFFTGVNGDIGFLTKNGPLKFGVVNYNDRFWIYMAITFYSVLSMYFLVKFFRNKKWFFPITTGFVALITLIYSHYHISLGKAHSWDSDYIIDRCIRGEGKIDLPADQFFRVDEFDNMDNLPMFYNLPTIQTFISVVPSSIMEFYPKVGVSRDVASRPDSSKYGLRSFLSVKYLLIEGTRDHEHGMSNMFDYHSTQNNIDIYENKYFIPMGFTYEYFMTEKDFEALPEAFRHTYLTKYLVVPNNMKNHYMQYLTYYKVDPFSTVGFEAFAEESLKRKASACTDFVPDSYGFTAEITLDKPNYVFFSVPFEKNGFTATVNGKAADIKVVDYGFMAVAGVAGKNEIVFKYKTPMSGTGLFITLFATIILILYIVFSGYFSKKKDKTAKISDALNNSHSDFEIQNNSIFSNPLYQDISGIPVEAAEYIELEKTSDFVSINDLTEPETPKYGESADEQINKIKLNPEKLISQINENTPNEETLWDDSTFIV